MFTVVLLPLVLVAACVVLSAVYVWSRDGERRARALEVLKLLLRRP